jgi:uncharacterized membrane protein
VKEFWIYTGLRVLLFLATLAIVFGAWLLVSDEVPVLWAVVIAFAISGVASFYLLDRSRQAFAHKVQTRAERASAALEAQRSKEDVDDERP